MLLCRPLAALGLALLVRLHASTTYRHEIARLPSKAERRRPDSRKIAVISALYEVDTQDWDSAKIRMAERVAYSLENISADYVETTVMESLVVGRRCVAGAVRCGDINTSQSHSLRAPGFGGMGLDGDLKDADPRLCTALLPSNPVAYAQFTPRTFQVPSWETDAQLETKAYITPLCVSPENTSLYNDYYTSLDNLYITGWRSNPNTYITSNPSLGIPFELHVVGRILVTWALFLNVKFILNGSIPMPLYQPEIVDEDAQMTDDLNVTIQILGLRQTVGEDVRTLQTTLPICVQPLIHMKGCFRIDQTIYENPALSEYKLKHYVLWNRHLFVGVASDQPWREGDFNVSEGPWPRYEWLGDRVMPTGPWEQWTFPQKESVYQDQCHSGNPCDTVPLAPSLRHLHTAVLYKSWNFEQHARRYLCNELPECGMDCLTNLTCLGGVSYYDQSFFFRSGQFRNDDNGVVPVIGLVDIDCPGQCCSDRRLCMRVTDVMGYEVPFDTEYMLIFGGSTYTHTKDANGRLVYHHCEDIPRSDLLPEWRSCTELAVGDLWRYDIARGKWDYIKPESAISPATLQPVGYPLARFGHAAVMVEEVDSRDPFSKRLWMYIFGGMGPLCQGVCNDVWRYEIAWAAQAYYPKFPDGDWIRGNLWERLRDCPFGGLYRHKMVATSGMEYIYAFGGQVLGGFRHSLYRYRISTDVWEDLEPTGRKSLTRLLYDYSGTPRALQVPTSEYDPTLDVDCSIAWRFDGSWSHCRQCPTCGLLSARRGEGAAFPEERGDFAMAHFADPAEGAIDDAIAVLGGYRTTWGAMSDFVCQTTTTTTGKPMRTAQEVVLTTESPYTTPADTTTTTAGAISVVGTFPPSAGAAAGSAGRRLQDAALAGPEPCDAKYYFDDLWMYDAGMNQWVKRETKGEVPLARKGHSLVARRAWTNDTQLVLFGGHNQDLSMNDIWVLDVMQAYNDRSWTRIDQFLHGAQPPSMSYHSVIYSSDLNMMVVFGGLHWAQTNLAQSDEMRNTDRRCFKEALGLPENERDTEEAVFFERMARLCETIAFCCPLTQQGSIPASVDGSSTRNSTGGLDLVAISTICRNDCEVRQFFPEFHPVMVEGVWGFRADTCLNDCSGRGRCDMSFCVCEPPWHGRDCSLQRCPGSTCYTHPRTKEQHCLECSQHGRCVNGECICYPGWGYEDCSAALCEANCSSTPTESRGICVEDFPVNQCHCFGHWSGSNCSELLCLNGCSEHGTCVAGICQCNNGYYGVDCSLLFITM